MVDLSLDAFDLVGPQSFGPLLTGELWAAWPAN
jgi:hypothetical protein